MRVTRPLFDPDPGWLFLLAGLAMMSAAVILPVNRQLHQMRTQVNAMHADEATVLARLKAHAAFRDLLAQDDPTLLARLAASQLNMIRKGERPVLVATTNEAPLTDWIDATVIPVQSDQSAYPESRLVRLVTGSHREWVIAASVFCVFAGLILGPARSGRAAPANNELNGDDESESLAANLAMVGTHDVTMLTGRSADHLRGEVTHGTAECSGDDDVEDLIELQSSAASDEYEDEESPDWEADDEEEGEYDDEEDSSEDELVSDDDDDDEEYDAELEESDEEWEYEDEDEFEDDWDEFDDEVESEVEEPSGVAIEVTVNESGVKAPGQSNAASVGPARVAFPPERPVSLSATMATESAEHHSLLDDSGNAPRVQSVAAPREDSLTDSKN